MSGTGVRGVEELDFMSFDALEGRVLSLGGTGYGSLKVGRKTAHDTHVDGFTSNT